MRFQSVRPELDPLFVAGMSRRWFAGCHPLALAGLAGLVLAGGGCGRSGGGGSARRYDVESCRIDYAVSGQLAGTETVWIDGWGAREAKWSTNSMTVVDMTVTTVQATILDGGRLHIVNLDDKTGMRHEIPSVGPAMKALLASVPGLDGGKKAGTETIAGRECIVMEYDSPRCRIWYWKNIPLKTEVSMMNSTSVTEAVRVEESPSIPPDAFTLPADITWTDL
jgi:hypothetical protein